MEHRPGLKCYEFVLFLVLFLLYPATLFTSKNIRKLAYFSSFFAIGPYNATPHRIAINNVGPMQGMWRCVQHDVRRSDGMQNISDPFIVVLAHTDSAALLYCGIQRVGWLNFLVSTTTNENHDCPMTPFILLTKGSGSRIHQMPRNGRTSWCTQGHCK